MGYRLCDQSIRGHFGDAWINGIADKVLQIQESLTALTKADAVNSFGKHPLDKGVILYGKFDDRLVHEVYVSAAPHPQVEKRD